MQQRFEILGSVDSIHGRRRYLGRRRQGPGVSRLVLLTRLPRRLSTDVEYLAELGLLSAFRDRHVAAVLELQTLGGELFLTHELCAGASLRELMELFEKRQRRIPVGLLARMLHDIAMGLDSAHTHHGPLGDPRLISHRELTPDGVVLSYEGVSKLVDFGHPRPPLDSSSAMAADLDGLKRLAEVTGVQEELAEAVKALQYEPGAPLPRPRAFADALAKELGDGLWTEEDAARFVQTEYPRRLERLRKLSQAEAVWAPPELGPQRAHRPAVRAELEAPREEPAFPPEDRAAPVALEKLTTPGTLWVRTHAPWVAAAMIALVVAVVSAVRLAPAEETVPPLSAPTSAAPAFTAYEPSWPVRALAAPNETSAFDGAGPSCSADGARDLDKYGVQEASLLAPLPVLTKEAFTVAQRAAKHRRHAALRLR